MDITYYKNKYEPLFGAWSISRKIGEGNFGTVYEIERHDMSGHYKSALKAITIPQNESEIESIYADGMDQRSATLYFKSIAEEIISEFVLMSQLKGNSNIVSYEDHQITQHEDGVGWDILIRMELLTPLLKHIQNNSLSRSDVIRLGIDICKALELCAKHNIIHRDIKPENIFVSPSGDFKLGDFGIARTVEKTTSGLSKKGTYTYMAPEVYCNRAYGASVDIYSLGIVLYKLLNDNRTPFLPAYPEQITHLDRELALGKRMRGEQLDAPKNADEALAAIVLKACAFEPEERYATPADMRAELEAIIGVEGGETITVLESSGAERSETLSRSEKTDRISLDEGLTAGDFETIRHETPPEPDEQEQVKPDTFKYDSPAPKSLVDRAKVWLGKKKNMYIAAGGAAVLLIAIVAIALIPSKKPEAGQELESLPASEPVSESKWSEWSDALPAEASGGNCIVETRTLYRSAPISFSDSDAPQSGKNLLFARFKDFGEWSEWQTEPVEESDLIEVEEQTIYRYQTLYSKQVGDGSFMVTKTSYYWSGWTESTSPVYASSSVRVQEIEQYRYREREAQYCFCADGDWSEFSQEPLRPSDNTAVETRLEYRYRSRGNEQDKAASMENFGSEAELGEALLRDIDSSKWYGSADSNCINAAVGLGAITADRYLGFNPDKNISLAEAVKAAVVLNRIYSGKPGALYEGEPWYQCYVDYAQENGIISAGQYSDFTTDAQRKEVASIMHNALPQTELLGVNVVTAITDMETGSEYFKSVYQLAQAGVISCPGTEFAFNGDTAMTRAETASIVERLAFPDKRVVTG